MDPILTPENDRISLFPIRYDGLWKAYKEQASCMWHAHEIKLEDDYKDWLSLTDDERKFIKMVLAFFASSDLIVNKNLSERFLQDVQPLEAKIAYDFQKMMENIHTEMYSLLIDTYIKDPHEKKETFEAVKTFDVISKKKDWAYKWINSDNDFYKRLIAFSAVEGIFFSGSFASIFWLRERGILHGLTESNVFISRDEGLHTNFAVLLHSMLNKKCPPDEMNEIITEAVDLEIEFINEALPCRLLGMNAELMTKHVKSVANRLVINYSVQSGIDYKKPYDDVDTLSPFPFMTRIMLNSKKNFFERSVSEYNKTKIEEEGDPYESCKF